MIIRIIIVGRRRKRKGIKNLNLRIYFVPNIFFPIEVVKQDLNVRNYLRSMSF